MRGDHTFTDLPKPYYSSKVVANPNAVDAQQATANLAANMLKECANNRALISCLGQKIADMAALTKEIGQTGGANLSADQLARLDAATDFFAYHLKRLDPKRAEEIKIDAYLAEVTREVKDGCANSAKELEGKTPDGTGTPAGGKEREREIKK